MNLRFDCGWCTPTPRMLQPALKMLTLKGIYGRERFETWYKIATLVQGRLDLSPLIARRLPMDDFQTGFDVMAAGKSGKVILDWTA